MSPTGRDTLLTGVANLSPHACEGTAHYGAAGQHPVPIAGKQGRTLPVPSRPAWQLLSGTTLPFPTGMRVSCPFCPAVRFPSSASAARPPWPATKPLWLAPLCRIPPFSKPSATRGARARRAFTVLRVHFWRVVNTYVQHTCFISLALTESRETISPPGCIW